MKVFAAGISTETNTFSPLPTELGDFLVVRGRDARESGRPYTGLDLSSTWGRQAQARGDHFVFSLMAWAEPAGLTVRSAYETLRDEILRDLQAAMPVDIVLLNLHGAMAAQGYPDCEEDIIRRIRAVTGPDAVIGAELDLHCHLSMSKIAEADIVLTYKEYPHTDVSNRACELFDLAIETRRGTIRPTMALFACQMIGLYPTSKQPMRGFVDAMIETERRPGVLSISLGHGFQFADVADIGAKVLAVTNNDPALAAQVARELGLRLYGLRRQIGCETFSLSMDRAFGTALASTLTPVVIADQSDNPGGGAPGDSTFALQWLLNHQIDDAAMALFYDPQAVALARKAGAGAMLSLRLGGKHGPQSGTPVAIEATVISTLNHYMQAFPLQSGDRELIDSGDLAAIHFRGISIVLTNRRTQCLTPSVFSDLHIDPRGQRLLVVKSTQHFYAAFAPIAGEILYMSAPGAVAPDPKQIPYTKVHTRRFYPWNEDPLNLAN
jgi:microcystin degradation protein MlrC